jgi:DNA-binding response OmpR family regulator
LSTLVDKRATVSRPEVHVLERRPKLEAGGESRLLHTVGGAGYVLMQS